MKLRYIAFYLFLLSCTILLVQYLNPLYGETYTNNLTTQEGTNFSISTKISGNSIERNHDFNVKVGLQVSQFSSSVLDLHDIYLAVKLANNNSSFQSILDHTFNGSISFLNKNGKSTVLKFFIPLNAPSFFDLYIFARFRENILFAIDPTTNVNWTDVTTITTNAPASNLPLLIGIGSVAGIIIIVILLKYNSQKKGKQKQVPSDNKYAVDKESVSNSFEKSQNIIYCPNCGTHRDELDSFCKACGTEF